MKRAHILEIGACLLALGLAACSSDSDENASRLAGSGDHGAGDGSELGGPGDSGALPPSGAAGTGGGAWMGSSGAGMGSSGEGFAGTGGASSGDFDGAGPPVDSSGGDGDGDGASEPPVQSGTLTAGVWDDNRNFQRFTDYRSAMLQNDLVIGALPTSDADHAAAHELFAQLGPARARLDVALVIDTTGSMGDEITYLQTELSAIAQSVEAKYPDAEQRWSLIVYRDQGDDYVVRSFEFTADVAALRQRLLEQSANGGGDFPEAPDAAFEAANDLAWRTGDDVARLLFWVADAPHHASQADELADAILEAQQLGIHVYPVASSGIDELTELTMRSSAQLTGGRYLFLTDDSGVGGAHKEPTIPCYFVTRLDRAMLRMVDIELTGEYREPTASEVIRKGGDPKDGACKLESGEQVQVF